MHRHEPTLGPSTPAVVLQHLSEAMAMGTEGENFVPCEIPDTNKSNLPERESSGDDRAYVAEALARRKLEDDILAGAQWRDGRGLFASWEDKLEALSVAFPVFLHINQSGNTALEALRRHIHPDPKRQPSSKNPALVAIRFVAKPQTTGEHKSASNYATMLNWPHLEHIAPEQFIERARSMTVNACKEFIRARNPRRTTADGQDVFNGQLFLTLRLPGRPSKRLTVKAGSGQANNLLALGSGLIA